MNIRVSNTNSNGYNNSAVRVYKNNVLCVEILINKRNPLGYLKNHNGKYRAEFIEQCKQHDIDYNRILDL